MAVYDAVHSCILLVYLAVDEPLCVTLRRLGVHRACVADIVFFQVFSAGDECWC